MWCKNCRQDVPAVSGAADEKPCCLRCGAVMASGSRGAAGPRTTAKSATVKHATVKPASARLAVSHVSKTGAQSNATFVCDAPTVAIRAPLSSFDTWELEEKLRHVDRILSGARFSTSLAAQPAGDAAQNSSVGSESTSGATLPGEQPRRSRVQSRLAWTVVALGAAALTCGILLLAAGALIGRPGWQSFGLPITLLGQVALLLGMMMQLDLVWQGKRETASKLYRFQKRLVDLESLAAELTPTTTDEAATLPDERELMAELKSRLDLLSHRLNLPCG
jgi:hypothetical protein